MGSDEVPASDRATDEDDAELLRALGAAFVAVPPVPARLSEFARGVIDWADLDAEVARMTFDSALERAAGLRSDAADQRALSYEGAQLEIELTMQVDMTVGQIAPADRYTVALQTRRGRVETRTDEWGRFQFPAARLPTRLIVSGRDGRVVTPWLTA